MYREPLFRLSQTEPTTAQRKETAIEQAYEQKEYNHGGKPEPVINPARIAQDEAIAQRQKLFNMVEQYNEMLNNSFDERVMNNQISREEMQKFDPTEYPYIMEQLMVDMDAMNNGGRVSGVDRAGSEVIELSDEDFMNQYGER